MVEDGEVLIEKRQNKLVTFPSTYQTSYTETDNYLLGKDLLNIDPDVNGPHGIVDSIKISRTKNGTSNMDAWGDLTTPLGTFNSLRQNIIEYTVDTTWQLVNGTWEIISATTIDYLASNNVGIFVDSISFDTSRVARWWSNDVATKYMVVEIFYEADGTVHQVDWLKSSTFVDVNEHIVSMDGVLVYPNPVKDEITIDIITDLKNNSLEIIDFRGKIVADILFTNNKMKFFVGDYNSGIYLYRLKDIGGNILYSDRFIVVK